MARIFISYRREDSSAAAGRLHDRLREHYGRDNVFMDVDSIEPGLDFIEAIERTVSSCDVLIALIGRQWLTIADADGRRRLHDPGDFVRHEVATALKRNVRVIPALIQDTRMPRAEELPEALKPLTRRHALDLSDAHFHRDVDGLVETLDRTLGIAPARPLPGERPPVEHWWKTSTVITAMSRRRRLLLAGLAVVAIAVGGYALMPRIPEPLPELPAGPRVLGPSRTPDPPVTWPPPDDRVVQAVGRCQATWKSRASMLAADPGNMQTLDTQADCGMVLVENARLTGNEAGWRDVVNPITPVLYQALEPAGGARAADLLAHLGWADFLRSRDGVGGLRPESFYRRAIEQDPDNPYANAMWGHWILWQRGSLAEAQARFHRALSSGREREYVRSLQIAALMLFSDAPLQFEAVRVANEMRGSGEPVPTNDAERGVWSKYWNLYYSQLLGGTQKAAFLAILPPAEHLATFRWLFPESQMPPNKLNLWIFFLATFQELNGERLAARSNYESLRSELLSQHASGRLLDQTEEGLRRLSGPQ